MSPTFSPPQYSSSASSRDRTSFVTEGGRIVSVAEVNGKLRALNLKDAGIQQAALKAESAKGFYEAGAADDYIN